MLGPDPAEVDFVVWQSDQDAYSATGQKCSAQSMLIAHENWMEIDIFGKLGAQVKANGIGTRTTAISTSSPI